MENLSFNDEISISFYYNELPVYIRFINVNDYEQTENALKWIMDSYYGIIGIDFEWVADLPWRRCDNNSISLIQIASHNRCVLFSTQGKTNLKGISLIRDLINSPLICKSGVGNDIDKYKSYHDLGTLQDPPNWYDVQKSHVIKDEINEYSLLSFNTLVWKFLVEKDKRIINHPLIHTFEDKQHTTFSNWNSTCLTLNQVIYSAFDAIAAKDLLLCISNLCKIGNLCTLCYNTDYNHKTNILLNNHKKDNDDNNVDNNDSTGNNLLTCKFCSFTTNLKQEIRHHYKNEHYKKKRIICSDCKQIFRKVSSLEMHQRTKKHGMYAITWECDYCLQHFHSAEALFHHEHTFCKSNQNENDYFSCNFCGESFNEQIDLDYHNNYCFKRAMFYETSKVSPPLEYKRLRGRKTKKYYKLRKRRIPKKPDTINNGLDIVYICQTCNTIFTNKKHFNNHQRYAKHGKYQVNHEVIYKTRKNIY